MTRRRKTMFVFTILLILLFLFFGNISTTHEITPLSKGEGGISLTLTPLSTLTTTITPLSKGEGGISPSPTATPSTPQFYTVLPGETLWEIAYKLGINMEDLAVANHLADANLIYAGQELYVGTVPIIVPEPTVMVGKQIIVILSTQRAYAYENGVLQKEFIVATGVAAYPTVTGNFAIYVKLESTRMTGPGYDIPDVPWTMYFYQGYGLHGAPWNNHLGTPGSHGCVNMSVEDADWLFHWASVGTPVLILP